MESAGERRWRISPQARAADTILHFAWVLENHVRAELSSKTDYGDIRANRARVSIPVVSSSADESALCRPPPFGSFVHCRERKRERERSIHPFRDRAIPIPSFRDDSFARSLPSRPDGPSGICGNVWVIPVDYTVPVVKLVLSAYSKVAKNKLRVIKHHYILPYSECSLFTRVYAGVLYGSVDSLWRIEQRIVRYNKRIY